VTATTGNRFEAIEREARAVRDALRGNMMYKMALDHVIAGCKALKDGYGREGVVRYRADAENVITIAKRLGTKGEFDPAALKVIIAYERALDDAIES
jgi:hypothetical protein